jgi:iron complex outermembrane recepter protein
MKTTKIKLAMLGSVGCATMAMATSAAAQAAPAADVPPPVNAAPGTALGEVVVTAQRRTERLQNVGIAVSAASGAVLKARGVTSTSDIVRFMPGINVSGSFGGQGLQFSIRGVTQSDFDDAIEAPIAVYIDDVYVASQQGQGMALYDMARVEALKGPQGTLFGRNATGGLIQFVVNPPSLDKTSGYLDTTYGSFNQTVLEGAVNLPLSDQLAIRASGIWNRHDAVWKNVYPGGVASGAPLAFGAGPISPAGQDLGGEDDLSGRLQLLWTPTSQLRLRFTGSAFRQNMSSSPWTESAVVPQVNAQGAEIGEIYASPTETRSAIGPGGQNYYNPAALAFQNFLFSPGHNGQRAPGANWFGYTPVSAGNLELSDQFGRSNLNSFRAYDGALHIDADLGSVNLASVTAWSLYEKNFLLGEAPTIGTGYGTRSRTETFSQEARLSGGSPGFTWTTGVYYLHINAHDAQGLLAPSGSALASVFDMAATGVDPLSVFNLRTDSTSLFGQMSWEFWPKVTLVVGGRGIYERQRYNFAADAFENTNNYYLNTTTVLFPLLPSYENSRTEDLWAGKVQLEYRPWNGLLVYGGVNRGVKAGSYNAQIFDGDPPLLPSQVPYKPETLVSLEGGFKLTAPGGRYTVDASAFHYFYNDYQSFVFANISGFVQNRNAETTGLELDASAKVTHDLTLSLTGAYVDAIVKDLEVAPDVFRNTRPAYTPKYSGSATLTYAVPRDVLGGRLTLGAGVSSQSSFYQNARNFAGDLFGGRTLVDLNSTLSLPSGFSLSAFIKNLTDDRYKTVGLDLSTVCGCNIEAYGMPRTFGVTVGYKF